jgi:ribosome-associated protein
MTISKRTFEITQVAAQAAIDKIADDVIALDLSEQLVLSEVFLIATGNNEAQVDAIADEVERQLAAIGDKPLRRLLRSSCSCSKRRTAQVLHARSLME